MDDRLPDFRVYPPQFQPKIYFLGKFLKRIISLFIKVRLNKLTHCYLAQNDFFNASVAKMKIFPIATT